MWVLILAGSPSPGCLPALAADTSSFQPSRGLAEPKATWTPPEPLKWSYFSIPQKNAGINPARPSPTRLGRSSFPHAAPRPHGCCKPRRCTHRVPVLAISMAQRKSSGKMSPMCSRSRGHILLS